MFNPILAFAGAFLSFGIAFFALFLSSRSFAYITFAVGMVLLSIEQLISGISFQVSSPSQVIGLFQMRSFVDALLPGIWLLFSLSFARANQREHILRWKWVIAASFVLPLVLAGIFRNSIFVSATTIDGSQWLLDLGRPGNLFYVLFLLGIALVLMNLEKTLRAFTGSMLWQIKFIILGLFGLFAARIYVCSQAILYSSLNTSLESVNAGAIIVADVFIIISLIRSRLADVNIYLSQAMISNSLTFLIIGIYLLAVGILAGFINSFGTNTIPFDFLFIFFSMMVLAVFLVSGRLRLGFKSFMIHHFNRPRYDYRKEWSDFTRSTASLVDIRELCATVAKMLSDIFGVPSVTIWLVDEIHQQLALGGSTVLSAAKTQGPDSNREGLQDLIRIMGNHSGPLDLHASDKKSLRETLDSFAALKNIRIRYCAPLATGKELLGVVTLSDRIDEVPFSEEDFNLLKTIADQTAGNLLNLRLFERLRAAKQMEAFQTVSSFFAHDLKNVASTLSMTLQNLPIYFDNAEFRGDALKVISRSVDKINTMCRRFSVLRERIELHLAEVDLNELVTGTVANLNSSLKATLQLDLHPIPRPALDAAQMQKVLTNLLLNANDAIEAGGMISVETRQENNWVVLSVTDDGCGISKEFLENSLFQPFKTTKAEGLGIGLYQSKMIVEAHQGAFEVESAEGKGATFRVKLPLGSETNDR